MNYYVFFCLDGVPILETILNQEYVAVEELEQIDWNQITYVILDFKSSSTKNLKAIEKGKIMKNQKILTRQFIYFRIDISKSKKLINRKPQKQSVINRKLMSLSSILFFDTPATFVHYMKEKKILRQNEIKKLENALINQTNEQEILDSWKNIKTTEKNIS